MARPRLLCEDGVARIREMDAWKVGWAREDVLVYSTAPLEQDLEVTGPVKVILYASSSARDTDFTAKLVDVLGTFAVMQAASGARVIQVFDSWVGALGPDDYVRYVAPYSRAMIERIRTSSIPVIHFGTGTGTKCHRNKTERWCKCCHQH